MKKILLFIVLFCTVFLSAQDVVFVDDGSRQALCDALAQAGDSLKNARSRFENKTVAILPIDGDRDSILIERLKSILTEKGFTCVEGKEDPMWNEIIKEIAWDERKDDILAPSTLVKFGKLKAAQILLYGKIRTLDKNDERIYAEVELHATDLTTKEHIWGGNFAARFYPGKKVRGIIALDNQLRMLLKKNFGDAENSLRDPIFAERLKNIRTVSVIPLAGDIDQYMTGLTIEMLTRTNHLPRNSRVLSLSQIRILSKSGQADGDAVLYGAVRDLRRSEPTFEELPDKKVVRATTVIYADIQLFLEDLNSGVTLWSRTVTLNETLSSERGMNPEEIARWREIKEKTFPAAIKENLIDNWKHYLSIAGGVIGILLLFVLIIVAIKAFVSYHHVR